VLGFLLLCALSNHAVKKAKIPTIARHCLEFRSPYPRRNNGKDAQSVPPSKRVSKCARWRWQRHEQSLGQLNDLLQG